MKGVFYMNQPSEYFVKTFGVKHAQKTDDKYVIIKNNVRLSLLTERLLRVEIDNEGIFTDSPTQAVINRSFCSPQIRIVEDNGIVIIMTTKTIFRYDTINKKMTGISLKGGKNLTEFNKGNLKGTYRTLDMTSGAIALGDGIMSTDGVAVIDDTNSLLLNEDGTISERRKTVKDEYYFCYNHDYRACLSDFFKLTGEVPLVPRFCLGNWWSRYKAYTQQEYIDLMTKFIKKEIPITVATIDMDWHWVDVKERFGKSGSKFNIFQGRTDYISHGDGWTGYSWNTELFPDYKGFLKWLHEQNFRITMNLHPAQGVRFFDDMYEEMAQRMGIDPSTKKRVSFDITDPKFIDAYFNVLHKPYERDGVDFWWIDWQQGKNSKFKNLDPLWALNHYHTLVDSDDESKRPLILSRYAEVGSHRYPLGFSGDTKICWECLDFQPYFTNTAANIGYTWWSHDIGGHHMGAKDDELYIRWVQYGLYSPIMRLHSTSNEFMGKEPWKHEFTAETLATNTLRERHTYIPYIYAMNYRTHKDCIALCEPMYYNHPEDKEAYEVKNQFYFGSELLVAPITTKLNKKTNLASVDVWLPEGRWTDIYTGNIYQGGQKIRMYRGIESIPVLAKEGAIIPLDKNDRVNNSDNPSDMKIRIFRGNNSFKLYEDDGVTNAYKNGDFAITTFAVEETDDKVIFRVSPAEGSCNSLPKKRNYTFVFEDISRGEVKVTVNGKEAKYTSIAGDGKISVNVNNVTPKSEVIIEILSYAPRFNSDKKEKIIELVTKYQLGVSYKLSKFGGILKNINGKLPNCDECFTGPIEEVRKMI